MSITEQHSRIRRKHSHGEQNTVSTDRISDLPDAVLCHILSFLRTKDSVRTSVLGKRWRYLWAYVPNLDFRNEKQVLINSVMLLRKVQSISSFGLVHDTDCDACQLETWVTFAIMRNVQKLGLHFRSQDALPRCLFTCKTLVHLSLSTCGVIPMRGVVCLPRLKKLYLIDVQFEADESLPHLLSGCPVLEELAINLFKNMLYCNVFSPTIKSFKLSYIPDDRAGRSERLEINTPALECLKIVNSSYEHIKFGALTSLIKAVISFYYDDKKDKSLLGFVHRLCNVKCLKLDLSYCSEIVDSVLSAWIMRFCNLTELKLTADCRFLSKFLESADNLEILSFTEYGFAIEGWSELPQQVPTCLLSNLRFINLVDIQGEYHEFEIIRYLLRNAKVLEQMVIAYPECLASDEEINMLKKISLFQRGSAACEVAFVQIPEGAA